MDPVKLSKPKSPFGAHGDLESRNETFVLSRHGVVNGQFFSLQSPGVMRKESTDLFFLCCVRPNIYRLSIIESASGVIWFCGGLGWISAGWRSRNRKPAVVPILVTRLVKTEKKP